MREPSSGQDISHLDKYERISMAHLSALIRYILVER
jgi:hypothetical protein